MKKWLIIIVLLVLCLLATSLIMGRIKARPQMHTATVKLGTITATVSAAGHIVPKHAVQVKSNMPGRVGKILVHVGQKVTLGQAVIVVRPSVTPSALSSALSRLHQAQSNYHQAHAHYARYQRVFKDGAISSEMLSIAKTADAIAKARARFAKEQYDLLLHGKATIGGHAVQNIIRSPISGYVLNVSVDQGDTITPATDYQSGTPLMTLANMHALVFKGEVSQLHVGELKTGMSVSLQVAAMPAHLLHARLARIDLQSLSATNEQNAGSNDLFATPESVQNGFGILINGFTLPKHQLLRAGYQAIANIVVGKKEHVLLVPQTALHFVGNKITVAVLAQHATKPHSVSVTLGLTNAMQAQVLTGVKKGERVVLPASHTSS